MYILKCRLKTCFLDLAGRHLQLAYMGVLWQYSYDRVYGALENLINRSCVKFAFFFFLGGGCKNFSLMSDKT